MVAEAEGGAAVEPVRGEAEMRQTAAGSGRPAACAGRDVDLLRAKRDPLGLWRADGLGPFMPPTPREAKGCALLFEGGGMRASYTTAAVVTLLEQGVRFPFVCGVSAGSSNVANYLHGDPWRARVSFTDIAHDPRFGGWHTFLQGKGFFSAHWLYQESCLPGGPLVYNYGRFERGLEGRDFAIQAFDIDSGESVVWGKRDVHGLGDLMVRVRASSTVPFMMPFTQVAGRTFADGGLGTGAGLALQAVLDAGYDRVFAVLTRPRGYRKGKVGKSQRLLAGIYEGRWPQLAQALRTRNDRYNAELDRLEQMAREGRAYIVYADGMAVSSSTCDVGQLRASYADAYARYQADVPQWFSWLGLE